MTKSLPLRHPVGVRVDVHWMVPVAFALAVLGLAEARLPAAHPGRSAWVYWTVALVAAGACFASLLARDGARAVVARRHGVAAGSFLWRPSGGAARIRGEAPTPGAELRIGVAGPLVSLGLALVTGLAALLLDTAGAPELMVETVVWLAAVNALFAVGHLLPGAPLDGSRLVRAVVWRRTRDRSRATAVAGAAGRYAGWPLLLLGLAQVVFAADLGGLWLALAGIFLVSTAD